MSLIDAEPTARSAVSGDPFSSSAGSPILLIRSGESHVGLTSANSLAAEAPWDEEGQIDS